VLVAAKIALNAITVPTDYYYKYNNNITDMISTIQTQQL
jgi:hypothetical protein